jgi:hypothetical protein
VKKKSSSRPKPAPASASHDVGAGLPSGLAKPAIRALTGAGYTTLDRPAKATDEQFLALHGTGPNPLRTIRIELKVRGNKHG